MIRRGYGRLVLVFPLLATLAACGDSGDPASGPSSKEWVGKTFLLDTPALPPGYWVQPRGIGGDVGAYVPQFLLGVQAGSGDDLLITLTTTLGQPNPGVQDTCVPTTQVTASGSGYPNIDIQASSFPMRVYDEKRQVYVNGTAHNLALKNVLPGNQDTSSASLVATVDIEDLYSLFTLIGPNPTKDDVCSTLQAQGNIPCETCAHSGRAYCLTLKAVQVSTTPVATPVQTITAPDCS
jgi:hypothetical protein